MVLGADKLYLMEMRLTPLAERCGLGGLDGLCQTLRSGRDFTLRQQVVDAMTINETFFFRDADQHEALRAAVTPALRERRAGQRELNFWSAATSSGQEAFSLAILLHEMPLKGWRIQILGTDLSEQMLERARLGRYNQVELSRGLGAGQIARFFRQQGVEWQIADEVRRMVRFEQLDLRQDLSGLGPFDVILCRNVLIYFDVQTKTQILQDVRKRLRDGGYLLLGNSETTLNLEVDFERCVSGRAVLYQVPDRSRA
jgi:chemotaxis protein methyltransferase CheR